LFGADGEAAIDATLNNNMGKGTEIRLKWDDENYIMVGVNYFHVYQSGYPDSLFSVTPTGVYYKGQSIGVGATAVLY
jgi:hypothetical protein